MTREEAIQVLNMVEAHGSLVIQAKEMAIKALEQEPKPMVEIDLYSVIKQKYIERDVHDKIRAEIENHCSLAKENHCRYCSYCNNLMGVREILEIIDKYKAESEEDNGTR